MDSAVAQHTKTGPTPPKYAHVTCALCRGFGLFCWTIGGHEIQEPCRGCNGKCTVVVERDTNAPDCDVVLCRQCRRPLWGTEKAASDGRLVDDICFDCWNADEPEAA